MERIARKEKRKYLKAYLKVDENIGERRKKYVERIDWKESYKPTNEESKQ